MAGDYMDEQEKCRDAILGECCSLLASLPVGPVRVVRDTLLAMFPLQREGQQLALEQPRPPLELTPCSCVARRRTDRAS